ISKQEKVLPNTYQVISIETVDDYIFVETNEKSFLIDKDKNVYDVGRYNCCKHVYKMGDDILAVLEGEHRQELVNIKTNEVYLSQRISYCSGIFRIDDDYVDTLGSDYDKMVFNIRTKEFIKPRVDIPVKFSRKVGPNLFVYEFNDYGKQIYRKFVIDRDGELVFDCGSYFPYFKDGRLILTSLKDEEVIIVDNVLEGNTSSNILGRNSEISSNPLVVTDENGEPESICFVSGKEFLIVDFDMNIKTKYPLDIESDYDEVEIQLWGDISVVIVKKGDESYCIALNIKTGKQIKHQGIWIIPVDVANPDVIRGCDPLDDEYYMFTIYDKDGNEYTHHRAKDCYNIHCRAMNLIRFYGVEGVDGCLVYNKDTREEKVIPWVNPEFLLHDHEYMDYGFGIRYGATWRDEIIDIFDLDFNVVFEGIDARSYKMRTNDFRYEVKNNLLLLTIPVSDGPRTCYRKVVMDREKNVIYDSYDGYLSFVGNFLQVIDEVKGKTYYIDSRTGKRHSDMNIAMNELALPDAISIDGETIRLIKN
ncbi:MAG: hypothetical protein K2G03_01995, partial [Bacilli bacterium]|nr:hypothetical protein [Bacilli bacterium]